MKIHLKAFLILLSMAGIAVGIALVIFIFPWGFPVIFGVLAIIGLIGAYSTIYQDLVHKCSESADKVEK